MEIKNSLDWAKIDTELTELASRVKDYEHRDEAKKVIRNIGTMVSQLSKLELEHRRSAFKSGTKVKEQLGKVNEQINDLEQWLTMLLLY